MQLEGNSLLIRADASTRIGTGHLMRCLALAQAWQDRGGDVTLLSHCDSKALHQRIIEEGFNFIPIEKQHPHPNDLGKTLSILSNSTNQTNPTNTPWLALDGYHFTPAYHKAIIENGYKLLVIDDMAHLDYYHVDIVLNQNIHASSLHYSCDGDTVKLLGCEYVLLRREFLKYKDWKREIPEVVRKVLVTLGGGDPENVTLKVIRAINELKLRDLEVKVVIGPSNLHTASLKEAVHHSPFTIHLLPSVENMPELMVWADIAISAGGSTCWELAFMGLPTILLVLADNQRDIGEGLCEASAAHSLGWFEQVMDTNIVETLHSLLDDRAEREQMSRRGRALVDGLGCERAVSVLHKQTQALRSRV